MVTEVSNSKSPLNGDEGSVHPAGVTSSEARAMLSAAFNIFERWGMSNDQARTLLGGPSERTFQRWKSKDIASVPVDTIWRLGDILGIHKALRYMFTEPDRGYEWVKKPNKRFLGKSALDVMLMGSQAHLSAIRNYLDAERGGW
jgi:hypothetical protein